jgi:hypothetical protein
MAVEITRLHDGKVLIVRATGRLSQEDYRRYVPEVERLMQQFGRIHILFEMQDFHGWRPGALWEDMKFAAAHFRDISRLAFVGDKKWERGMGTFCRPFTRAEIRYFERDEFDLAREWVEAGVKSPVAAAP